MRKVPYINYKKLNGFYTAQSVAKLLRLTMRELAEKGRQYGVRLYRDDAGRYLLDGPAVKKLHYMLYHESRGKKLPSNRGDAQWA